MILSRRHFLLSSLALPAVPLAVRAIDPVVRPASPKMTLGVAAYSFRKELDLKKPTMTLFQFIDLAAKWPVTSVELTSYYFAETTPEYLDKLKTKCAEHKLSISGVPIRTDFCLADASKRAAEVAHTKTWIDHAVRLGAPTIRIFAGNLPKGTTLENVQNQVVTCLQEVADVAEKKGITLVLENHGGITGTPEGLLALIKPITGKGLAINVDTGNFKTADPYTDLAKIVPYGRTVQLKTEIFPQGKPTELADLQRLVQLLRDGKYDGVVVLEHEANEDPHTAVPKYLNTLQKLLV